MVESERGPRSLHQRDRLILIRSKGGFRAEPSDSGSDQQLESAGVAPGTQRFTGRLQAAYMGDIAVSL